MGARFVQGVTDLATVRSDLAASWHPTKNGALSPTGVMPGSGQKVWWMCSLGHEWTTTVASRTRGAGCPVCAGRSVWPGFNDLATTHPTVTALWHPTRNGVLTPKDVSAGVQRRVWWVCSSGHEWEATVVVRSLRQGSGCPFCAGKAVWPGFNDLATVNPDVAASWHPTKNGELTAQQVTTASEKKVWWVCSLKHEWQTLVGTRTSGAGCPVCSGWTVLAGFNDLATTRPDIAASWHPTKNGAFTAQQVTRGSGKSAWWVCPLGHEWKTVISERTKGSGCPYCAGRSPWVGFNDLATTSPHVAASWHPDKNGAVTPRDVTNASGRQIWWVCPLGHEWKTTVVQRTNNGRCPVCNGRRVLAGFNDLATTNPSVAASWHPTRNGALTPQDMTKASMKKVWWICPLGHEWETTAMHRVRGSGCHVCANLTVLTGFNDLATTNPTVAASWHPTRNETLVPQGVTISSGKTVWWLCPAGHEWKAQIGSRAKGGGCPKCARYGFDQTSAAVLYFLSHHELKARKIGITNITGHRISDFKKHCWIVLYEIMSPDGNLVLSAETALLSWIRNDLKLPIYLGQQDMSGRSGWTETFTSEGPTDSVVIDRIKAEIFGTPVAKQH